ncbi:MAG: exodeoxyribonuclease VII large subunit [Rhodoferax sp.]
MAEAGPLWQVSALCHALADTIEQRFNPVRVQGEISGFARAASGHCYFNLKDAQAQLRCALFKRAAAALDFAPRDGDRVEVLAALGVYEPRGDLQLVVQTMQRAGQGTLMEEFLQRKARLAAQGLFDAARKRPVPAWPRAIGLVTSLGAAALHDVLTTLRRRAAHVPVVLIPSAVQGATAPQELIESLSKMYRLAQTDQSLEQYFAADAQAGEPAWRHAAIDVILLVRGGGSLEDLWAFNDEALAHTLAASPVPVICGVGHETDFTLADFVADVRAPTPTAAAELAAPPRAQGLQRLDQLGQRLNQALQRRVQREAQRLDWVARALAQPQAQVAAQRLRLSRIEQRLTHEVHIQLQRSAQRLDALAPALQRAARGASRTAGQRLALLTQRLPRALALALQLPQRRLERLEVALQALGPQHVLARGFAWLADGQGQAVTRCTQTHPGQALRATLVDGTVDLTVTPPSA